MVGDKPILAGIRGWLLALVLWLVLYMPLFNIGFLYFVTNRMEEAYPLDAAMMEVSGLGAVLWSNVLLRSALYISAGLLLWKSRRVIAVWWTIGVIWFAGPLIILAMPFVIEGEIALPGLVRSTLISLAWTAYLLKSERVKNTYGTRNAP